MITRKQAIALIFEVLKNQNDNYIETLLEDVIDEDEDLPSAEEIMEAIGVSLAELRGSCQ